MTETTLIPPLAPKKSNRTYPTRWEKEKAAAGSSDAFDNPNDPKFIGPWVLGETIGKGASGRVKIARHRSTGMFAAVKIIPYSVLSYTSSSKKAEKHRTSVEREIVLMKLMEHPNIMRLYDVWEGKGNLYLILEWVEGGELFDLIVERGSLRHAEALGYFKQLIYGLSYCHAFSIAHRDLKPENILIHGSNSHYVKIADWGMAAFQTPYAQLETSCGSPHYASPEVIRGEPYDGEKADVWSAAIVLYALLAGRLPFDDPDVPRLLSKVRSGRFEIPDNFHADAADLIKRMLVVDVNHRITMAGILKHPFLKHDTPGIYYIPPPSVSKLQLFLESEKDIDPDIFISIRIIYGRYATGDGLRKALLSKRPTRAKTFYTLLSRFRERRKETFEDSDPFGPPTDLHPYQPSRTRIFTFHTLSSPAIPNNIRQHPARHHTRTRSSPPCQSPSALVQSRIPVMVNTYAKAAETDAIKTISTNESKGNPSEATLVSNKVSDSPVPSVQHATDTNTAISRDATRISSSRAERVLVFRPKSRRRDTAPDSSSNAFNAPHISQQKPDDTRRVSIKKTSQTRPSSVCEVSIHEPFIPIKAPRLRHPEAQQEMDELVKRMNALCLRDVQNMQMEGKTSVAEDGPGNAITEASEPKYSISSSQRRRGEAMMVEKENVPIKARVNEFGRKVPNLFRRGSTAESSTTNDDSKRSRNDRSLMRRFKMSDLENSWISAVSTSDAPSVGSESSPTSSTPLLTPIVQEFKGWFSNIFHLKHPVYKINSFLNCVGSKDEIKKLLEKLGIQALDDLLSWNVLKCKVGSESEKTGGSIFQRYIKFRVEFHPHKPSTGLENSTTARNGHKLCPLQQAGFTSIILFIPEKGSLSSFKAVCEKIQDEWRFEISPPADAMGEMGRMQSKEINALEGENSFMIVQLEM